MNILKKFYIYLLLLFFLIIYFVFESSYIILKYDYEKRLIKNYGYCERSSYDTKYIEKFKPSKISK